MFGHMSENMCARACMYTMCVVIFYVLIIWSNTDMCNVRNDRMYSFITIYIYICVFCSLLLHPLNGIGPQVAPWALLFASYLQSSLLLTRYL